MTILRIIGRVSSLLLKLLLVLLVIWYGYCTYLAAWHLMFFDAKDPGERWDKIRKYGFEGQCFRPGRPIWELWRPPPEYRFGWVKVEFGRFSFFAFLDSFNTLASLTPSGAFMVWEGYVPPNKTHLTWDDRPWEYWYERQTTEMHKRSMALDYLFWREQRCRFREPEEIKPVPLVELRWRWTNPDFGRKLIWAVSTLVGVVVLWASKVFDRRKALTES
jgi:hypothetical protein